MKEFIVTIIRNEEVKHRGIVNALDLEMAITIVSKLMENGILDNWGKEPLIHPDDSISIAERAEEDYPWIQMF